MQAEERIVAACQRLWQNRGIKAFTMDELAAEAGYSKRTVYKYYSSKEEILDAVVDCLIRDVTEESDRIVASGSTPEQIFLSVLNYIFVRCSFIVNERSLQDMYRYYPEVWQKINDFRSKRIEETVRATVGKQESYKIAGTDPVIAARVVRAAIIAVLDPQFMLENGYSFEEVAGQLASLMLALLKGHETNRPVPAKDT